MKEKPLSGINNPGLSGQLCARGCSATERGGFGMVLPVLVSYTDGHTVNKDGPRTPQVHADAIILHVGKCPLGLDINCPAPTVSLVSVVI